VANQLVELCVCESMWTTWRANRAGCRGRSWKQELLEAHFATYKKKIKKNVLL